eukprot:403371976
MNQNDEIKQETENYDNIHNDLQRYQLFREFKKYPIYQERFHKTLTLNVNAARLSIVEHNNQPLIKKEIQTKNIKIQIRNLKSSQENYEDQTCPGSSLLIAYSPIIVQLINEDQNVFKAKAKFQCQFLQLKQLYPKKCQMSHKTINKCPQLTTVINNS